jgi:hypothetical protein
MNKIAPLNGAKTHPLTAHALGVLRSLLSGPKPRQEINAGVVDRFQREDLTETVRLPSPYKIHKGSLIDFERITDAGRAAVANAT